MCLYTHIHTQQCTLLCTISDLYILLWKFSWKCYNIHALPGGVSQNVFSGPPPMSITWKLAKHIDFQVPPLTSKITGNGLHILRIFNELPRWLVEGPLIGGHLPLITLLSPQSPWYREVWPPCELLEKWLRGPGSSGHWGLSLTHCEVPVTVSEPKRRREES